MQLKTTAFSSQVPKKTFRVLGMMSGTSMDALDLVTSEFSWAQDPEGWSGQIIEGIRDPLGEPLAQAVCAIGGRVSD